MATQKLSALRENPLVKWLLQAKRIPLLFSVTVVAGIFYHYAPGYTWLWILLSLLLQAGLFKLFDFVKAHHVLGGAAYVALGTVFLAASATLMQLGESSAFFAPDELNKRISFFVWFLTPQSVLTADYPGYTLALFLLFTYFIASTAYYFTFVRYRVLMSFTVMLFPFAVYAKENEDMPIPSIIILLVCYFAVMIYCRQAHAESGDVVQPYAPDEDSRLKTPSQKSEFATVRPEILDGKFLRSAGMFLAASSIFILILPKPTVEADRTFLNTALDLSALSSYLENAISGFMDTSDGGTYTTTTYARALYYTKGKEPLDLSIRTFTNYDYDEDAWHASDYDGMPAMNDSSYVEKGNLVTLLRDQNPVELMEAIQAAAKNDPEFAARWHLENFANMNLNAESYYRDLTVYTATFGNYVFPAPQYTTSFKLTEYPNAKVYQNRSGVIFRYNQMRLYNYNEQFEMRYLSPLFAESDAAKALTALFSQDTWAEFLWKLQDAVPEEYSDAALNALMSYGDTLEYVEMVKSDTPDSVRELAAELTAGKTTDYEKAMAIYEYLRYGDFVYSLDFPITDADNVETFLFQNKIGVCYQFAGAMAELCRAAGLPTRYIEGYMMSEPDTRLVRNDKWDFMISTQHAHAFTEVYIAGYGWMRLDATTSADIEAATEKSSVLSTLQIAGLIMLGIALLLLLLFLWLIPMLREKHFRRWYQKHRNTEGIQAAFARLRKQWHSDPALTAKELCEKQGAFLQVDLSVLLADFEHAVYANRTDEAAADRVFRIYCAAHDAYKPALKRQNKAIRAARKKAAAESAE